MNFLWIVFLATLSSSLASLQNEAKVVKKSFKSQRFWLGPIDGFQICAKHTKLFHPFDCPYGPDRNPFKRCNDKAIRGIANEKFCEDHRYVCCSTVWNQLCCLPPYPTYSQNNHNNLANKRPDEYFNYQ